MKTIKIIGYPGVGKTRAVSTFMSSFSRQKQNVGKVVYHKRGNIVVIGNYDGSKFQGTDKLSMAVATDFLKFYEQMKGEARIIIAEGDRVNCERFNEIAKAFSEFIEIQCVADDKKLQEQRIQREHVQSEQFLKTIKSKVDNRNCKYKMDSETLRRFLHWNVETP